MRLLNPIRESVNLRSPRAVAEKIELMMQACLPNASNATLYENLKLNFIRDIAPIAGIARDPFVIEVNPSVPVKTVPELIAYAKVNPGKINMTSSGIGSGNHIFGELFKMMTGVNLVHVPYRRAGPRACRSARWTGAGHVRQHVLIDRIREGWQTSCAGGDNLICRAECAASLIEAHEDLGSSELATLYLFRKAFVSSVRPSASSASAVRRALSFVQGLSEPKATSWVASVACAREDRRR